jgi:hypothetical protein
VERASVSDVSTLLRETTKPFEANLPKKIHEGVSSARDLEGRIDAAALGFFPRSHNVGRAKKGGAS